MRLYAEATTFDEEKLLEDIESKRQTFTDQPSPPYAVGDLWLQGENGDIMVCKTARASGSYTESDWERASKYTDDEGLSKWIEKDYAETIKEIGEQIDGKAETYFQEEDPSLNWSTESKPDHKGDLWYRTTDATTWYYTGGAWVQQNVPDAVFDQIDGKSRIWTTQPVPPYFVGDLYFSSATSDILTCMKARTEGESFTSADWVKRNKYTDDELAKSKNKTFYADNDHRPTGTAVGDIWYRTDDNNQPYRWDGSAWVTVRDGTIETAAGTASKFIAELTNGIFVHPESSQAADKSPSTGTGVWITDAISIIRAGLSFLWAGVENSIAKIRLGLVTAGHVILNASGMEVYKDANTKVAEFGASVTLGPSGTHQVRINDQTIEFVEQGKTMAYMAEDKGYFTNMEVGDAMYIGNYSLRQNNEKKLVIGRRR